MNIAISVSPLTETGLLRFSGPDTQTFLQGQLSCDVAALQPLRATHGSYNTPKGRMLASFVLWRAGADYFMQLPRALCEPIRKRLSMYILRAKVQAADVSDDYALFGLVGENTVTALAVPAKSMTLAEAAGGWALRLDARRVEVIVPAAKTAEIAELLKNEAEPADEAAWELAGIHAGIPVITPATQEEFVPQMANLDLIGGVSFSKGCYPGQEIVARMHYLGKLKQRMVLGHLENADSAQPGDKLFNTELAEQAAGTVVNAAPAKTGGFDVLAVVQTSTFSDNGLHFGSLTGPALKLLPLPYSLEITELPKTKPD
jgi:folate-binding protein YgfZ